MVCILPYLLIRQMLITLGMALTFESAEALVQLMKGRQEDVNEWLPDCYKIERIFQTSSGKAGR